MSECFLKLNLLLQLLIVYVYRTMILSYINIFHNFTEVFIDSALATFTRILLESGTETSGND